MQFARPTAAAGFLRRTAVRRFSATPSPRPFDKILIANRGEIACRVIRSAKKLGIKTVAVFSDVDATSMHVREADEAYCIGKAPSRESYLCIDKIIDVAKRSGAQAIHPGYGFLSENPKFADSVETAGLVFVGPSSAPMLAMGDKINSKRIAKEAGCFVIPGFEGEVPDEDAAARLAADVGYPVMIKASAGGGGKGMRVARSEAEVREGFRLSQAEARSSFGDDRMLIERFIEDPHHIEIQVLADAHGNVVAFPERECSVQRRNQKVIEESPSCLLTPATRRAMQEQAMMLCRATGYRSAGTVEMLADGNLNFYFLEMNTRLQVEHPITELVTGEDLVEHMLWIAAGRALPPRLTRAPHLEARGWALEARVYAEDPLRGFLPSTGPLVRYVQPPTTYRLPSPMHTADDVPSSPPSDGDKDGAAVVRVDTGVCEGASIGVHYDPMIAKLCTHAATRAQALAGLERALDRYVVRGVGNNLSFLRAVCRNARFRAGDYGTGFIAEQFPAGFTGVALDAAERGLLAGTAAALHAAGAAASASASASADTTLFLQVAGNAAAPDAITHSYRATLRRPTQGDPAGRRDVAVTLTPMRPPPDDGDLGDEPLYGVFDVRCPSGPAPALATVDAWVAPGTWPGDSHVAIAAAAASSPPPGGSGVSAQGEGVHVEATAGAGNVYSHGGQAGAVYRLRLRGSDATVVVQTPRERDLSQHMLPPEVRDLSRQLRCPMPGTLISMEAAPGMAVEQGQQLCCVEAMKMVNVLRAPKAGVVAKVLCDVGAHLKVDAVILEFE